MAFTPDYAHTHQVLNQPEPLTDYNAYNADRVLQFWIKAFDGEWGRHQLQKYGKLVGTTLQQAGFEANKFKPEFTPHDRFGHRVDQVDYHPAYHQLMSHAIAAKHHCLPWVDTRKGKHVVRAGLCFLHTQADPGSGCPLTMTFASVAALKHQKALADSWTPKIVSTHYDPSNKPYYQKKGLTIGMAMTEKQGGSDVRANSTVAYPMGSDSANIPIWELIGHKWFCSAPMSDGFLVTAQADRGVSCFLVPRWKPDGSKNPIQIQRLKDKAGNVSNASSEIEFRGAFAWQVGKEGRGIPTIIEMVSLTRFDCMVASSAIMTSAIQQALHHTAGRRAFGQTLNQQPLMKNVLADLALEAEAALAISMRMANALDNNESALLRIGTAIGKYWICKRAPQLTYECMETIGAVGLIKDNILARLYTEAPVNAIWEGSGNVQCLDVLRAIKKEPATLDALLQEFANPRQSSQVLHNYIQSLEHDLQNTHQLEYACRSLVERLAIAWQASTLLQYGDAKIAEAFVESRIKAQRYAMYGAMPDTIDCDYIIERAQVKVEH